MHYFWDSVILPLLVSIRARTIVEIGAADGKNTRNILEYANEVHGTVHTIDTVKSASMDMLIQEYPNSLTFYAEQSLTALPKIHGYDAVLIDGDHNWYTVFHELKLIYEQSQQSGTLPLILLHDTGWPYAYRDLYYDPSTIPPAFRHPYNKGGITPLEHTPVSDGGLNCTLHHSTQENIPRCGVLCAVEDFLSEHPSDFVLTTIPGLYGISILAPRALLERTPELRNSIDSFGMTEPIVKHVQKLEDRRITLMMDMQKYQHGHACMSDDAKKLTQENMSLRTNIDNLQKANRELLELIQENKTALRVRQTEFADALRTLEDRTKKQLSKKDIVIAKERRRSAYLYATKKDIEAKITKMEQTRSWQWTHYFRVITGWLHALRTSHTTKTIPLRHVLVEQRPQNTDAVALLPQASLLMLQTMQRSEEVYQSTLRYNKMESRPCISYVLCFTDNDEQALRRTLNSLVQQTYRKWELHIWHNANDTLVPRITQDYAKRYPEKIHCHATHARRNALHVSLCDVFTETKGDFVLNVQPRSLLKPTALETMLHIHTTEKHPHRYAYIAPYITADLAGVPLQLHPVHPTQRGWYRRVHYCVFVRTALEELASSNPSLEFTHTATLLRALSCIPEDAYIHDEALSTEFA